MAGIGDIQFNSHAEEILKKEDVEGHIKKSSVSRFFAMSELFPNILKNVEAKNLPEFLMINRNIHYTIINKIFFLLGISNDINKKRLVNLIFSKKYKNATNNSDNNIFDMQFSRFFEGELLMENSSTESLFPQLKNNSIAQEISDEKIIYPSPKIIKRGDIFEALHF